VPKVSDVISIQHAGMGRAATIVISLDHVHARIAPSRQMWSAPTHFCKNANTHVPGLSAETIKVFDETAA